MKKIGVMTSGGDAPGMNPCIRAVTRTALFHGLEVIGVNEGYEGLIHGDMQELTSRSVGGILQSGGTILQTARSDEFRTAAGQREAIRQMNEHEMTGLVVIGGDGSLSGAHELAKQGVKVIGIPGSIDNDIWGTNMAIGVDTALNTILSAIDSLRDTASSHNRAFIVEVMGRNCGYLAVMAGINGGADIVLIPEIEVDVKEVAEVIEAAYTRGKNHSIVVVAEGASLHAQVLKEKLDKMDVGFHTRVTILGHTQRGGRPTAFDRLLATRLGVKAVEALIEGESDKMVGLMGREVELVPLEKVIKTSRKVNMEYHEMCKMLAY